jgi:hypothetical protein
MVLLIILFIILQYIHALIIPYQPIISTVNAVQKLSENLDR